MKCVVLALAVATCLSGAQASSSESESNPIKKVLEMMQGLADKIVAQGEEEHKLYVAKTEFCQERASKLGFEIKTGKAEVADLQATIDQQTAVIQKSKAKIEDLSSDLSTDEADLKEATAVRKKAGADF